jgi:hypothetical protein
MEEVLMPRKKRKIKTGQPSSFTTARYDTVEEAVAHAAGIFNPMSIESDIEIGGGIVKDRDDKFYFTFTIGEKGAGNLGFRILKPKNHDLVGIWHSHGAEGNLRDAFSETDVKSSNDLGVPSYIVDSTGAMRTLPTGSKVRYVSGGGKRGTGNRGEPVLGVDGQQLVVRTLREQAIIPTKVKLAEVQP